MFKIELGNSPASVDQVKNVLEKLRDKTDFKFIRVEQTMAIGLAASQYHREIARFVNLPLIDKAYAHDAGHLLYDKSLNKVIFFGESGGIDPIDTDGTVLAIPSGMSNPEAWRKKREEIDEKTAEIRMRPQRSCFSELFSY